MLTPNGTAAARPRNVQRLDGLYAEATHEKSEDDGEHQLCGVRTTCVWLGS